MDRLEFLKRLGLLTVGATLVGVDVKGMTADDDEAEMLPDGGEKLDMPVADLKAEVSKPVSVIIIGAGNRGRTYSGYASRFPDAMRVVGVADLNPERRDAMRKRFSIPEENCFGDFHEVFEKSKFADAVVIATPDNLHYEPCMMALAAGYDVLLEKPVAPTEKECRSILAVSYTHLTLPTSDLV